MATSYPNGIDDFTDPTADDPMDDPPHHSQHGDSNDAINAIETFLGTSGSPNFLELAGGTMSGGIAMGSNKITGLANGVLSTDAATVAQAQAGGACGVSGVPGACGVSGVAGSAGACGVSGVAGACGVSGVAGACGVSGVHGACGVSGTAGSAGACGVSGVAGACGVSGVSGNTGLGFGDVVSKSTSYGVVSGDNGTIFAFNGSLLTATLPGTAPAEPWLVNFINLNSTLLTINPNGLTLNGSASSITLIQNQSVFVWSDGSNYEYGEGLQGSAGACGVSGVAGACGVSGTAGACGVSGTAGAAGACGVSGVAGSAGACGVSGVAGACGVSGVAGACGVSGVSGVTGIPGSLPTVQDVTVSSQAATVSISYASTLITNNASSSVTITMTVSGAADGQISIVRFLDHAATAESLSWVGTENSTVSVPGTSNGSTTLPITAGFIYNGATSLWRCMAVG